MTVLRQIDCRNPRLAVSFKRLEDEDESRPAVLVEAGQPFAEAPAIYFLPSAFRRPAQPRRHDRSGFSDPDFLAVHERENGN